MYQKIRLKQEKREVLLKAELIIFLGTCSLTYVVADSLDTSFFTENTNRYMRLKKNDMIKITKKTINSIFAIPALS